MTDFEREAKAEEIKRALRNALPAEPPHELGILLRRSVALLEPVREPPEHRVFFPRR